MMNWNGSWGWGSWLGVGLVMLVFWSVIVVALVVVVRSWGSRSVTSGDGAERILDQRFARGEMTEDEYTRRRALLDRS